MRDGNQTPPFGPVIPCRFPTPGKGAHAIYYSVSYSKKKKKIAIINNPAKTGTRQFEAH
jgi:hypothetical protein